MHMHSEGLLGRGVKRGVLCADQGRGHAAEQRKERESLEELIHSIQLESELTSRALKQSVSVSHKLLFDSQAGGLFA